MPDVQQNTPTLDPVDAVQQHAKSNEAAAMELADDLVWKDPLDEPVDDPAEPDTEAEAKPPEKAEPDPVAEEKKTDDDRKTFAELEAMAAEKRRERQEREARDRRDAAARDLDRERDDFERRRRAFEAAERELEADPIEYLQRRKGWDPSVAAEKIVGKTLRPAEAELRELLEAQAREIKTLRERYETDTQARQRMEQEARDQAHLQATYSQWQALSADAERFPELAWRDPEERRWRGDRMADRLREAYPGRQFSHEEVAAWVEHDLQEQNKKRAAAAGTSSGGTDGAPAGNGAGTKRPPATLTNDLASQSASSGPESRDWDTRRKNALRELSKAGW